MTPTAALGWAPSIAAFASLKLTAEKRTVGEAVVGSIAKSLGIYMHKLILPRITERIYMFTPPVNDVMHVVDHDEVYRLSLAGVPAVKVLDDNPYKYLETCGECFGVSAAKPLLESGPFSVSYTFNSGADTQLVSVTTLRGTQIIEFPTLSGDWFIATLTRDAAYLLLAEPYLLEIYRLN